jgi:FecR protein
MKQMSNALVRGFLGIGTLVLAVSPGSILMAEDTGSSEPSRAVRLSNVEGEVHLSQGNTPLADQAVANTPLFEGTTITTGNDGRAEIQFEDGSVARVSPQSSLTLGLLRGAGTGDRDAELQLNNGLGYFELQGDNESNHIQIRFGDTVLTTGGFAVIRINLDKAPGEVAVFSGNVHLEGGATPALDLHGGESVALNANDPGSYNLSESIEPDSWDSWNSDRDQALTTASAGRTAATNNEPDNNNPAWSDLDANGNWYNVPDQGYVWSPNEAATPGWDPYGNGYWMSTPSYGYTWISGYPWGYLPYQCGGWNYYNSFGWGWAPGTCTPWWGGGGVYVINIVVAPHGYHYPVRPHPYNPRPMVAGRATPAPLVVVDRRTLAGNISPAPRDRSGAVMIAGNIVHPLKPLPPARAPYNGFRPAGPSPNAPASSYTGRSGMQNGPRAIAVPAHPGNTYSPSPSPRPSGNIYTPAPPPRPSTYVPPSVYHPAPPVHTAPPSPPPASHPAPPSGGGGGGGAHPSGGGPHR